MATAIESIWRLNKEKNAQYQADLMAWNQWFTNANQQAQTQAQTQAGYDISQAYENFKQSQRAIMNTASMGEGSKERYQATLQNQYATTENQIRNNMTSTLASSYQKNLQQYQSGLQQATKEADERAKLGGRVEEYFANIASEARTDDKGNELSPYFTYDTSKGETYYSKYYSEGMEKERTEGLTAARFTDLSILDRMADEDPELYYEYMNNRSWIDPMLFDMDDLSAMGTYSYENSRSKRDAYSKLEQEAKDLGLDTSQYTGTASSKLTQLQPFVEAKKALGDMLYDKSATYLGGNIRQGNLFKIDNTIYKVSYPGVELKNEGWVYDSAVTRNSDTEARNFTKQQGSDIELAFKNGVLKDGSVIKGSTGTMFVVDGGQLYKLKKA